MLDAVFCLPVSLGVLGLASESPKMQGGKWRTDLVELQVRDGRFIASAASLHLCAIAEGAVVAPDDRPRRVLVPAKLWQSVCQQAAESGAAEVEVRLAPTGARLSFGTGSRRTTTDVPAIDGTLPPVAEVLRGTRTSSRHTPEYKLGPKSLAKVLRITSAICPGAPLQLAMGPGGRLRVDARVGQTTLALVFATPPGGSGSCDIE
jgi:hypothetical protein